MKLRKLTVNLDQLMQTGQDASLTLNTYAHALPDEEYDLSYLPEAGAGTNHKLRSVGKRASS
jgi:hypothetical protein